MCSCCCCWIRTESIIHQWVCECASICSLAALSRERKGNADGSNEDDGDDDKQSKLRPNRTRSRRQKKKKQTVGEGVEGYTTHTHTPNIRIGCNDFFLLWFGLRTWMRCEQEGSKERTQRHANERRREPTRDKIANVIIGMFENMFTTIFVVVAKGFNGVANIIN